MNIIGCDPGKAGGITIIADEGVSAISMPETVGDLVDTLRTIKACNSGPMVAYVEAVHSSPQMGVVSAFTFGRGLGNLEAALQSLSIPLRWVRPQAWQKAMGCLTKGDKNVSKRRAQELFPTIKVTHAIADSLLIAEYGRRTER